jgi:hypothetical protein
MNNTPENIKYSKVFCYSRSLSFTADTSIDSVTRSLLTVLLGLFCSYIKSFATQGASRSLLLLSERLQQGALVRSVSSSWAIV